MSTAFLYAIAALVCYGLGDLVYKRAAAAGIETDRFLMGQSWFFCPAVFGYGLVSGDLHMSWAMLWGGMAGLGLLIGLFNFLYALKAAPVTVAAPVFRLNFILTALLAIVILSEPAQPSVLVALGLSVLAAWLLLGGSTPQSRAAAGLAVWGPRLLIATLAMGAVNLFHKLGLMAGATPASLVAAQAAVFITSVNGMVYARRRDLSLPLSTVVQSAMAAIVLAAAFIFLLQALQLSRASVVVPIAQMGFVVTAAAGVIWFGEALTKRKMAGLCAAVLALAALAVS